MKWDQTSDDNLAVIGAEGSIQKLPLHCSALIALEGQGGKCWRDLCPARLVLPGSFTTLRDATQCFQSSIRIED